MAFLVEKWEPIAFEPSRWRGGRYADSGRTGGGSRRSDLRQYDSLRCFITAQEEGDLLRRDRCRTSIVPQGLERIYLGGPHGWNTAGN